MSESGRRPGVAGLLLGVGVALEGRVVFAGEVVIADEVVFAGKVLIVRATAVVLGRNAVVHGEVVLQDDIAVVLDDRRRRRCLGFDHQRHRAHLIVVADVHHPHALRSAAVPVDAAHRRALDHAVLGDEHELLMLAHDQRAGQRALVLGQRIVFTPIVPRPLTG